jgi:hypothetical protein
LVAAPDGFLYVADLARDLIRKVTTSGVVVGGWHASMPCDLALSADGQSVYVTDEGPNDAFGAHVDEFALDGAWVRGWGHGGAPGPGSLDYAWGVAADSEGHVYVLERWLQKFTASGQYVAHTSAASASLRLRAFVVDCADRVIAHGQVFDTALQPTGLVLRPDARDASYSVLASVPGEPVLYAAEDGRPADIVYRLRTASN